MLESRHFRKINAGNEDEGWRILFYYNLYRLGLAILLIGLASPLLRDINNPETTKYLRTLIGGIAAFSLISVATFVNIRNRRPALYIQAHLLFVCDIIFITVMTLSHYLVDPSTIILYITTAAATAVLFHLRVTLIYTSIISGLIFYNDYQRFVSGELTFNNYYLTPILVVGLFSVVVIVALVAKRSLAAQTVVEEQEKVLADLDQINQVVLDQIDLGVIVINQRMNIELINTRAEAMIKEFLGSYNRVTGELADVLSVYLKLPNNNTFNFRISNRELGFTLIPLRNGHLIQIEDQTNIQKQIQQSKLASIGRMASAISHEIRNPLSAINHAAQLLTPNPDNAEDAELIQIIRSHSRRIDEIVDSILVRSRPGKAQRKTISLRPWLKVFINTFKETIESRDARLMMAGSDGEILFDPTQLEQILTNLCQNSVKYAKPSNESLKIRFFTGTTWDGTVYLDVTDNGRGIDPADVDQLFEPFHTSDSKSTGLGLFLVKEFCNYNGAEIDYLRGSQRQGFRITFMQPGDSTETHEKEIEDSAPEQDTLSTDLVITTDETNAA